jgi:hypothetical protein
MQAENRIATTAAVIGLHGLLLLALASGLIHQQRSVAGTTMMTVNIPDQGFAAATVAPSEPAAAALPDVAAPEIDIAEVVPMPAPATAGVTSYYSAAEPISVDPCPARNEPENDDVANRANPPTVPTEKDSVKTAC